MYSFQINLIFNCVVYDSKCPILSPTHTRKKGPVMPSLKKIRCVTREEKLFQTRVRCFHTRLCLGRLRRPRLRLVLNTSPSLEIAHFPPLLHNILFLSLFLQLFVLLKIFAPLFFFYSVPLFFLSLLREELRLGLII